MKRLLWSGMLTAGLLSSACAPTVRVRLPPSEDYMYPRAVPGDLRADEARRLESAWHDVLRGRSSSAELQLHKLLARRPGSAPLETALAFARMRGGRHELAQRGFEAVLARQPEYLPALVGAGSAALRRGEAGLALAYYRRASVVDPQDATVRRRLGEIKVQVTERCVAVARSELASGNAAGAVEQYRRALDAAPELAGVRLDLANLLLERDDILGAVGVLGADPAGDRQVLMKLAEVELKRGEPGRALEVVRRALARDPRDSEAQRLVSEARRGLELQRMPGEYRRVFEAARITRADLAALLSVKVTALARLPTGETPVAVDISGSWAREHILAALSFGLMEVYPNHTFQPAAIVRRGDVARAVARILDLVNYPQGPVPVLRDMSQNNIFHDAAVRAVSAGLMDLTPEGAFEPWRPMSGADAAAVIEGLARLVGP